VEALYVRGVARGLKSTYIALVDKSFLAALRSAVAARRDHERVLQIDPKYVDAKTIVGAHNYVVGSLPMPVKLLAGIAGFTWRGVFLAMGLLSIGMTLCCLGLRDPGFGRWDTDQVRAKVHEASGDDDATVLTEDVELGFWEICRRLMLIPTSRRLMAGVAVLGVLTVRTTYLPPDKNFGAGWYVLAPAGTKIESDGS